MPHKFRLQQEVRLIRPGFPNDRASTTGVYKVTRLMPPDVTGELSYHIKSASAGERAVRESEIIAASHSANSVFDTPLSA